MNKLPNCEQKLLDSLEEHGALCCACGQETEVVVDYTDDEFGRAFLFNSACCGQPVVMKSRHEWKTKIS